MKNNVTSFPGNHFGQKSGNGGGNDLEARIAKLESDVSYIQRDIVNIREELRDFRSETGIEFKNVRSELKELRDLHHKDFRIIFGAIITVTLGLAGLMAKGFGWL